MNRFTVTPAIATPAAQQGLGTLGQALINRAQEQKSQEQSQIAQSEIMQAFRSNDPERIAAVSLKYPQESQVLTQQIRYRDEQTRQNLIDSSRRIAAGEDPYKVINQRAEFVASRGGDPSDTLAELEILSQIGEDKYREIATNVFATQDPKGYQSLVSRTGEITPEQQQKLDIEREKLDIRRFEAEQRALDRALRAETNELKKQELEQKLKANQQKIDEVQKKKQGSVEKTQELAANIKSFLDNEQFVEDITGLSGRVPAVTPSGIDAEVAFEQITNLLTLDNLGLMTGVLTDRDIAFLKSASSGIREGMSKPQFVKRMSAILKRVESKLPEQEAQAPSESSRELTIEQLVEMYGN